MVETGAAGRPFPGWEDVAEDIVPAADDTYDLGSATKRWAAAFIVLLAVATSITIGGVVKIYTTGTTLMINESTQIEGNLTLNDSLFAVDINATGLYYGNGSQLTGITATETDPYWTGNETNTAFKNEVNIFSVNQNMSFNNMTTLNCLLFQSGGKICSGV